MAVIPLHFHNLFLKLLNTMPVHDHTFYLTLALTTKVMKNYSCNEIRLQMAEIRVESCKIMDFQLLYLCFYCTHQLCLKILTIQLRTNCKLAVPTFGLFRGIFNKKKYDDVGLFLLAFSNLIMCLSQVTSNIPT